MSEESKNVPLSETKPITEAETNLIYQTKQLDVVKGLKEVLFNSSSPNKYAPAIVAGYDYLSHLEKLLETAIAAAKPKPEAPVEVATAPNPAQTQINVVDAQVVKEAPKS